MVTISANKEARNVPFKTIKPPWKTWKYKIYILYILKKINLTAEKKVHSTI